MSTSRAVAAPLRIGLDVHRIVANPGGSRTYLLELLPALLQVAEGAGEIVLFFSGSGDVEQTLARLTRHRHFSLVEQPFPDRADRCWRALRFPAIENLRGPTLDVLHSLLPLPLPSRAARTVISLQALDPAAVTARARRRALESAHAIVVPSRRAAGAVTQLVDLPPERVRVIYPGVHSIYREPPKPALVEDLCRRFPFLQEPYLLAIGGAADAARGVPFLVEVVERARAVEPALPPLVVLATAQHSAAIADHIERGDLAGRVWLLEGLDQGELPGLYRGAELLLDPTWDHAFGQSLLEAAACGVPAIADARCGAVEVLQHGAATLALDPAGWAAELVALHRDRDRRQHLGRLAQNAASGLTWRAAAERHWELYAA